MREFINEGTEFDAAGGDPIQTAYKKINSMTNELYGLIGSGVDWGSINGTLSDQDDLQAALDSKADGSDLTDHENNTGNPHSVTADQVGLGNVDNTADADKPISTATQAALDSKLSASQGAAVDDSTATDVSGLVSDFNELLASLRAAGIISQ